jgi:hypothetical protein
MAVAVAVAVGGRGRQCRFPVLSAHCTGHSTTQNSTNSSAETRATRRQSPQRAQQRARQPRRGAGSGAGAGGVGSAGLLRPTSIHTKPGASRPGVAGCGWQHSLVPSSHTGSSHRRCSGILACSWRLVRSAGAPAAGTAVGCRQNGQGMTPLPGWPVGWAATSRARHSRQKTWVQESSLGVLKMLS